MALTEDLKAGRVTLIKNGKGKYVRLTPEGQADVDAFDGLGLRAVVARAVIGLATDQEAEARPYQSKLRRPPQTE
jgi:hypothetical protein